MRDKSPRVMKILPPGSANACIAEELTDALRFLAADAGIVVDRVEDHGSALLGLLFAFFRLLRRLGGRFARLVGARSTVLDGQREHQAHERDAEAPHGVVSAMRGARLSKARSVTSRP